MQTPALKQLMGAYFHQDWDLMESTHMEVVSRFVAGEPQLAPQLALEIDQVLSAIPDEAELEHLLEALGCEVVPDQPDGYRAWLARIANQATSGAVS